MRVGKYLRMALKYIDIGANLTDPMFRGIYNNSQKHPEDLNFVLERGWQQGLQKIIVTSGHLEEVEKAKELIANDERLYTTVGVHPTRCYEFIKSGDPQKYMNDLREHIKDNPKVVAIGECGLDYDRLEFCAKEIQLEYFEMQLDLAAEFGLPLFLHMREAIEDFMEILDRNQDKLKKCGGGVVHSFTGDVEEAESILAYGGLSIGINGCSLKSHDNVAVVKELPNELIMIETDAPWCGIRPSHAGYEHITTKFPTVKKKDKWNAEALIDGRNEPCQISQVLEAIAGIKQQPKEELAEIYYQNTMNMFFKDSK